MARGSSFLFFVFLFCLPFFEFFFLCSHWSIVDVALIFSCPAHYVPDRKPRVLLGMVNARSVSSVKNTYGVEFQ